jgi:FkbM family methyltransferase
MSLHYPIVRSILQRMLSLCFATSESIPILVGPLARARLPRAVALSNLSLVFSSYEPSVVSEITSLPSSIHVAYDVGAHVGLMTLTLVRKVGPHGKVVAFEPCPSNVGPLQELVCLNSLQDVVDVLDVAVADYNGEALLLVGDTAYMHKLETVHEDMSAPARQTFTARVTSIDTLVFRQGYPPPQLIKVDVEGAEALVIRGGLETLKRYSPFLLLEIHGPANADTVWDLLFDLGYEWKAVGEKRCPEAMTKQQARSFFSKESWTHHFLLTRRSTAVAKNEFACSHMFAKEAS